MLVDSRVHAQVFAPHDESRFWRLAQQLPEALPVLPRFSLALFSRRGDRFSKSDLIGLNDKTAPRQCHLHDAAIQVADSESSAPPATSVR